MQVERSAKQKTAFFCLRSRTRARSRSLAAGRWNGDNGDNGDNGKNGDNGGQDGD